MKISHVIRGMEWLSSTGKHVLLYKAFDRKPSKFMHLPLITRDGKKKLSKRDKDSFVDYYTDTLGALPVALLNLMIRNGSGIENFASGKLYTREEMIVNFNENLLGKRNLQLDDDILRRLSRLAFERTSTEELVAVLRSRITKDVPGSIDISQEHLVKIIEFLKSKEERFTFLSELTRGQFQWLLKTPQSSENILKTFERATAVNCLQELATAENWSTETLKQIAGSVQISFPQILQLIRYALIDSKSGPPIQELVDFYTITGCKSKMANMLSLLQLQKHSV